MKNTFLLLILALLSSTMIAQKTKEKSIKIEFQKLPTVPVEDFNTLGIQVFTADLPLNEDSLRHYLNNLDFMMSDAEQASKVKFQALNDIEIIGGEGDITVEMAFGNPMAVTEELKTSSCMGKKSECTQYYYVVQYYIPTVVQIRKNDEIYGNWELKPTMELKFGNEQVETRYESKEGTTTSVQVIEYKSEAALKKAYNSSENASLVRKAILTQLSEMADIIYEQVFFKDSKMKLDFVYGSGKATDYTETETAADNAVAAFETEDYALLDGSIEIWENWIKKYEPKNKKAAVNKKVALGFHENLAIAYCFQTQFDQAKVNIKKAIELANMGNKNSNVINRLEKTQQFIEEKESATKYNANLDTSSLKMAPNIKKTLGKRKLNENLDFLKAEDKYQEFKQL